jgi:hypothetical protein
MALLDTAFHKLNSLQYLRGISALAVVLYHIERGANVYWSLSPPAKLFDWGGIRCAYFLLLVRLCNFLFRILAAQETDRVSLFTADSDLSRLPCYHVAIYSRV